MNQSNFTTAVAMQIDPDERRWLERKAIQLARERGCTLPAALVAARCEFESLRARPKAIVIPLIGHRRRPVETASPDSC
jgi:hypothetical protein